MPEEDEVFLDIMANPPRVGKFSDAVARSIRMETDWGKLPIVGLRDLIALKRTQRLEDYPVISRLALMAFEQERAALAGPRRDQTLTTTLEQLFTLETLAEFFALPLPEWAAYEGTYASEVRAWRAELSSSSGWSEQTERRLTEWMQRRIAEYQALDREHWKPVIRELKSLHQAGQLMPVGQAV